MTPPSITSAEAISDFSSIFASSSSNPPMSAEPNTDSDDNEFLDKARQALSLSSVLESKAQSLLPTAQTSASMARSTSPLPASIVNGIARSAAGVVGGSLPVVPTNNGAVLPKDEVEKKVAAVQRDVQSLLERMRQAGISGA